VCGSFGRHRLPTRIPCRFGQPKRLQACMHICTSIMITPFTRHAPPGARSCHPSRSRGTTASTVANSAIPSLECPTTRKNPPSLHFRCGPRRKSGKTVPYAQHTYCHTSSIGIRELGGSLVDGPGYSIRSLPTNRVRVQHTLVRCSRGAASVKAHQRTVAHT
jgi:hypothetical protein